MYILKNALRNISRSKGRNILIGIIVLAIAFSSCIALSIREVTVKTKESSKENLKITAQISIDREKIMSEQTDRESMKSAMANLEMLSLDDMLKYAENKNVKEFYYTASVSLNAGGSLEAVDTTGITEEETESGSNQGNAARLDGNMPDGQSNEGGMGGKGGRMGMQGDFTLIGYSSDEAMTAFVNGTSQVADGAMFEQNDATMQCVISSELATYNELKVGDTIKLANPNDEDQTYKLTVCGIYKNEENDESSDSMMGGFSASYDSANQIYTSYENLQTIIDKSQENATTSTDSVTGREITTAIQASTNGTYTFASVDKYEAFKSEVEKELGDNYTVTSNDITAYESSLAPLDNLSKYAGYFLVIILVIGGIILVVLNLFNIRERKYEIGVLAAIGMKKPKIAMQFITELIVVTFAAIIIGTAAGAVVSVPTTNKLLEQQVSSAKEEQENQNQNFGRGMNGGPSMKNMGQMAPASEVNYVSQISQATDIAVVGKLILIGIVLSIASGCVAIVSILKYDPLKILSNRD